MTKKRRNNGRAKHGRGHVKRVHCDISGAMVPKDKAIKRFIVRNMVERAALFDLKATSTIPGSQDPDYKGPKIYHKVYYSISAAIKRKICVRSRKMRRNREIPEKFQKAKKPLESRYK